MKNQISLFFNLKNENILFVIKAGLFASLKRECKILFIKSNLIKLAVILDLNLLNLKYAFLLKDLNVISVQVNRMYYPYLYFLQYFKTFHPLHISLALLEYRKQFLAVYIKFFVLLIKKKCQVF